VRTQRLVLDFLALFYQTQGRLMHRELRERPLACLPAGRGAGHLSCFLRGKGVFYEEYILFLNISAVSTRLRNKNGLSEHAKAA
jgi:hypothetical protein